MDRSPKFKSKDLSRWKCEINPAPIVAKRIKIQRVNDEWLGCCPDVFHRANTKSETFPEGKSDTHPSFTIYKLDDGTWLYKCFSCGANGNIFEFVQAVDKIPFAEAVARVLEEAGGEGWQDGQEQTEVSMPTEAAAPKETVTFPMSQYSTATEALEHSPDGQAWLRKRGISMDTARKFKLGFVQSAAKIVPVHAWRDDGWVLFPTLSADEQTVTAVKYRSIAGKKQKQDDGEMISGILRAPHTATLLYNLRAIQPNEEVWIVEGEPDTLVMAQAGLRVVGYPMAEYKPTEEECARLSSARRVFLAGDTDPIGTKAMAALQKRLHGDVYVIKWPNNRKDANDVLTNECGNDTAKFKALVEGLKSAMIPNPLKLNLISLSDIDEEIQEWLWKNRIPKDALTNLSGDADKGKSLVLYDLMARLSTGADMPDGSPNPFGGRPMKVILMFSEGSLKTTVKPRMRVMGANMANVLALKSVSRKGETDPDKRQFSLEHDLNVLRQALLENPDVVFIGFDPITNYLGDNCNMNRSQDVRRVLTPLGELAEDCGMTIVAIIHFNKNRDMSAMHRTGGAAALVEVPRAAWCCLPDDDPEHKGEFVFVPIKNNLGKRVGGLRYRIEETFIDIKGQRASEPHLIWGDVTEKTADDILSVQSNAELKGVAKAKSWLEATFKDDMARRSAAMYSAALAVGISEDCIKKARAFIRLDTKKSGGVWYTRRHQGDGAPWVISTDLDEQIAKGNNQELDKEINRAGIESVGTLAFEAADFEVP